VPEMELEQLKVVAMVIVVDHLCAKAVENGTYKELLVGVPVHAVLL